MTHRDRALRYRAFISYSHADEAIAARLHRRLETYRLPRGISRRGSDDQSLPGRLQPVFRDRDELPSAGQLSHAIEAALDQSDALIVICSPAAVASRWVGEEIRRFRVRHPERPVLAFVASGEPGNSPRDDPSKAAFPLALLLSDPEDNSSSLLEPLAADARSQGDGFAAAFLKLVAGLIGVGLDELRQRDLRRRQRWWALATSASLLLSACFGILAWQAMRARDEARQAQAQAELELTSERQTRDFLLSVFELADTGNTNGEKVTVREVLDRAVARIDSTPFDRAAIKSRFLATMGQAYDSLGLLPQARKLLIQSLEAVPSDDRSAQAVRQRVDSQLQLADVTFRSGEYQKAVDEVDALDRPTPDQRALAAAIRGDALTYQELDADALHAYQEALAIVDSHSLTLQERALLRSRALNGMAVLRQFAGDYAGAEQFFAQAQEVLMPVFGDSHPASIATIGSRATNAYLAGDTETAKQEWQRSLSVALRLYDPLNPNVGTLKNNLGRLALETDDLDSAEAMLNDAIASDRKFRTEGFDDLAYPLNSLAMVKLAQGDTQAARGLLDEALSIAEAANHPILGAVLTHMADLDCLENPTPDALAMAQRGLDISAAREDASEWRLAEAHLTLTWCHKQLGHTDIDRMQAEADAETIRKHFTSANVFTRRAQAQRDAVR